MPELADPCEEAAALRNALRDLSMGKSIARVRHGDSEVTYTLASLDSLQILLSSAEKRCQAQQEPGTRLRYARPVRVRPY